VSVAARPTPVQLPLPGGSEGATVRVHPLRTADMLAPPAFFARPGGPLSLVRGLGLHVPRGRWHTLPIPAFLVEHPGVGPFLVDTGMHARVAAEGPGVLGKRAKLIYRIEMEPEWAVAAQVRARGFDPDTIPLVVMTHLHYDHTGGIAQLPGPTYVVDQREWESAARHGFTRGYIHDLFDHPFDWRSVDFDGPDAVPVGPFGRTLDLFGDGSVRLLSTPGHTDGHLSLLLRLAQDELLLVGDAAYAQRTLDEGWVPLFCPDVATYRHSLAELQRYAEDNPAATVICGHDPWSWPEVAPVYA